MIEAEVSRRGSSLEQSFAPEEGRAFAEAAVKRRRG